MAESLRELIERQRKAGVLLEVRRPERPGSAHQVTAVIWRPGDPNALAAAIIAHCKGPMRLELDGRSFAIAPEEGADA